MTSSLGGRACASCTHPQRAEIDRDIVSGMSASAIGRKWNIGRDAIGRHKAAHLPRARIASAAAQRDADKSSDEADRGDDLMMCVMKLRQKAVVLLQRAEAEGDLRTSLAGIREALSACQTMAKLAGAIKTGTTVNVNIAAAQADQNMMVASAVLGALRDEPVARAKVLAALAKFSLVPPTVEHEAG